MLQNIERLSGDEETLVAEVPEAGAGTARAEGAGELRALMREVEALKAERDSIEAELKDTTVDMRAQFLTALQESGAIDEPALSACALGAALAPLQRRVSASLAAQEALLARVQSAHAARGAAPDAAARDAALGALAAAHDAFQELTANLTEGTKFYNDLTQVSNGSDPAPLCPATVGSRSPLFVLAAVGGVPEQGGRLLLRS